MKKHITEMKLPMYASFSLTFALMGDAFLYSFLPANALFIQVPVIWIGTVLSINRFTRILLNPLILYVFSRAGFRWPTILASITAVMATAGYGAGYGVSILVVIRILWGISYSILRISAITYAMDYPKKGLALGVSQSVVESGPLLALLAGPILLEATSPRLTFIVIAILSVPGIYFAFKLKERQPTLSRRFSISMSFPSVFNRLAFFAAFLVEGMLVVLMAALLMRARPGWSQLEITTATAAFLGFRRICSLLISPIAGWAADRFGLAGIYSGSMVLISAGLLMTTNSWVMTGLVLVFMFYNVNASLAAGAASEGRADVTHAISISATYRDAGSAFGALAGGALLTFNRLDAIFSSCIIILLWLSWNYFKRSGGLATQP